MRDQARIRNQGQSPTESAMDRVSEDLEVTAQAKKEEREREQVRIRKEIHQLFVPVIPNEWWFLLSFTIRRVTAVMKGTAAKKST